MYTAYVKPCLAVLDEEIAYILPEHRITRKTTRMSLESFIQIKT